MNREPFDTVWASLDVDSHTQKLGGNTTIQLARGGVPVEATLPQLSVIQRRGLEIGDTIGSGGMGVVRVGVQHPLGREVAVKTALPELAISSVFNALRREALITGALEHPNIVPLYQLDDGDSGPVIVMKKIEGVPWSDVIDDFARAPGAHPDKDSVAWHLGVFAQVCNAVHFAHSRAILHRDLKPENVMVGSFGEVYVLDWGIALCLDPDGDPRFPKAVDANHVAGTPCFMAPEMTIGDGAALSVRTDVYLLGAILHTIVTGQPRHLGNSLFEIMLAAYESPSFDYPEHVPAELAEICNRAMAADPAQRFPSADELRLATQRFLNHRASTSIAAAAAESLRSLEEAVASGASDMETTVRVHELFTNARFGLQQALEIWPGNQVAQRDRRQALRAMIAFEIDRDNPRAAHALLVELDEPDEALASQIAALEAKLERRQREVDELERFSSDLDLGVGSRPRSIMSAIFGVLCFANLTGLHFATAAGLIQWTGPFFIAMTFPFIAVVLFLTAIFRRWLLANQANRRVVYAWVFTAFAALLFRVLVVLADLPVMTAFGLENGIYAFGFAAVAVAGSPRVLLGSVFFGAGAVFGTLVPSYALLSLAGSVLAAVLWVAYLWWPRSSR